MQFTIREPGSAITHFIGMILAISAGTPLLIKASEASNITSLVALSIFLLAMILLYGASTTYHSVSVSEKVITICRKIDHMMIFVLIAGSYTPVCLTVLRGSTGYWLLFTIWGLALTGMFVKVLWITCPKWFSSLIYIAMGWSCVSVFGSLIHSLSFPAMMWLGAGGMIYTAGGILYACKLPLFNSRHPYFGSHEIFHLFVMGGSICHFIFMYLYIA